ncbi:MAG TPA: SDR family oxidoreductase [Rugosimonospora sp.]
MSNAQSRDLTGTVVAITGASAGIGREAARQLVEAGASVALSARRADRLDELVAELGADRAVAVAGDVRLAADNQRLVDAALARFGRLDSLVANAGIGAYGGILDGTDEELVEMIETNFTGTMWSVRAAVPAMLAAGGGDVVIVSSVAGLRGGADEAVYAGTKFAQMGLAGSIDRELREKGIRVSTINPAGVHTEFAIGRGRTEGEPWLDEVLRPEDVAAAIVTVLRQPRRLRTQTWSMWSMAQGS